MVALQSREKDLTYPEPVRRLFPCVCGVSPGAAGAFLLGLRHALLRNVRTFIESQGLRPFHGVACWDSQRELEPCNL